MNKLIDELIALLEEMNGAQNSDNMVEQIHNVFIAVNKAQSDEVYFIIKRLRRMKVHVPQ